MRIALVVNTSWNIFNFRRGLIKSLINQGHEVITIAPNDDYSKKLEALGCTHYSINMDSRGINPFMDLMLIFELIKIYRKAKPDVLLHYTVKPNIYGTIAASVLRIPTINNVCGLGTAFLERGPITRIVSMLYKFAFRFSSKVFFQNFEDCRLFTSENLVNKKKVDVLPGSGVNLSMFKPSNLKPNKNFTFLLIGRVIREKGIIEYIDAIKKIKQENPEFKFQLLGEVDSAHRRGLHEDHVEGWVKEGLIDYLGTVDDIRPAIEGADCIVLPSYREGTSRTLLEAASMGKPIITSDTAGCNNVVDHEVNGLLCKPRNSDDLADQISKMATLPKNVLSRFGKNSRSKMKREFDEKIIIEKYSLAIDELKS